ncbi:MAG: GxxExxY protein [Anaerolineae bacterium]
MTTPLQPSPREDFIGQHIVAAAIEVHRTFGGPGLLESLYEEALVWELRKREFSVERQKPIAVRYKGVTLGEPLVLDVLVENLVIVECKATLHYHPIFEAQTLTYLRVTGLKLGYVINFGEKLVKNGIRRVVNGL